MRPIRAVFAVLSLVATVSSLSLAQEKSPRYEKRWIYVAQNLAVEKNVEDLLALLARAQKAGYNGMVLADYKLNILDRMHEGYFRNVKRVMDAAKQRKIEIIPAVFPVGYSEGLLAHDPNLAEGLPVVKAPFLVKGRQAALIPNPSSSLKNGGLEQTRGDVFAGFSYQDNPGKVTIADRSIVHGGKVSCRIENVAKNSENGNARLIQRVTVRPHAAYRYSAWVKTKDLENPGGFHLTVIGNSPGARTLTFHETELKSTQDWTRFEVVFNSLDEKEVNIYAGIWGGRNGTLWVDDLAFEELGLLNVLRREGCPVEVTSHDGRTRYEEGRDYEPVRDPKLGVVPYEGLYDFSHDAPPLRLSAHSRIKNDETILVSWYHPVAIHGSQIACCLSDPNVDRLLRDQAQRVNELFHPRTFLMSHDEIRVANWCKTCRDRNQTAGELLADNVQRCTQILKSINPKAEIFAWSDMFDPFHNAVKAYYLVDGSLEGSWKGLSPEVVVLNWNGEKAKQSLDWFAGRGHRQVIAGYYDVDDLSGFESWDRAAQGVPRVRGFLYTTWQYKYELMEKYGTALRAAR